MTAITGIGPITMVLLVGAICAAILDNGSVCLWLMALAGLIELGLLVAAGLIDRDVQGP